MNEIHTADSLKKLDELDENNVHAVVTDPPYGLAFMGRDWDDFEPKEYQEWCQEWAEKAKQVLKPGGHLLAFSGNRTHHRLFTGVEDAGFEIRDTITWHYGSGFPKAADIGKTIDKREGEYENREMGEKYHNPDGTTRDYDNYDDDREVYSPDDDGNDARRQTIPATREAKKWDGWKTGLKPATEYVVMARKPFDGATVDCVLEHGTGALNIDTCRVGTEERKNAPPGENDIYKQAEGGHGTVEGRYPSNVVFDEIEAERLDERNGESNSTVRTAGGEEGFGANDRDYGGNKDDFGGYERGFDDSGGPSRYFYTSKASKSERTENGSIDNSHPTVKPQDLMEWLIKLVTREGQVVLDPFTGSGTTLKAAKELNRQFIGIEKQAKWADVARVRVGLTPNDPSVVRDDNQQEGLEEYQ